MSLVIFVACSPGEDSRVTTSGNHELPVEPQSAPEANHPAAGRILAEPILSNATVVGGIDNTVVMDGMAQVMSPINECYSTLSDGLAGKLLVKFAISADGTVAYAKMQSTTLRHPELESCVLDKVTTARFPPLDRGRLAVVRYPLSFPPSVGK